MASHDDILAGYSPGFRDLHARIGNLLRQRFDGVEEVVEYDMAAYAVPVRDPPLAGEWKGTMPRTAFIVGPTEMKAGITVHVWHPNRPHLLKDNAEWLKQAGFKPMVGCLQWNRRGDFPIEAFGRLLAKAPP